MSKYKFKRYIPRGPENTFSYFVAANPATPFNPVSKYPKIDESVFLGPFSTIIGDVTICEDVFIAPNVSIRADEGTPFYIGERSNIQDGAILHGLRNTELSLYGKRFSIYIGAEVSIGQKSFIYGPCVIGNNVFIAADAIVSSAIIEDNCYIDMSAIVSDGVRINTGTYVPVGALIDNQQKADSLPKVTEEKVKYAQVMIENNNMLNEIYRLKAGEVKYSVEPVPSSKKLLNRGQMNRTNNKGLRK